MIRYETSDAKTPIKQCDETSCSQTETDRLSSCICEGKHFVTGRCPEIAQPHRNTGGGERFRAVSCQRNTRSHKDKEG